MTDERRCNSGVRTTIEGLKRSAPSRVRSVEFIETHFAWVFLLGSLAYKMKKPLRRGSMDYRTVARRERACRDEVRLNRRLARSVYLGVVPLVRQGDGSLGLGRGKSVADWMVRMRRLPAERMLDRAIGRNALTDRDAKILADLLSHFFRYARRRAMSPRAYVARLRRRTRDHGRELRARDLRLSRRRVDEVIRAQLEFITKGGALLGERGSHLIDGHGDLRAEHVYLGSRDDPPAVIDCLEFSSDLRRLDPAEEMAFLALECIELGAGGFARELLRRLRLETSDPVSDALVHFYMSQRATVQAMIAIWHLRDGHLAREPRRWRARATTYLTDALRYIRLALRELQQELFSPPRQLANASGGGSLACRRASAVGLDRTAAQSKE